MTNSKGEPSAYAELIAALRAAPTGYDPSKLLPSYTVFGPGGVSWGEIAAIIEGLAAQNSSLQGLMENSAEVVEQEAEYEYSFALKSVAAVSFLPLVNNNVLWFDSFEAADAARSAEEQRLHRYDQEDNVILVARVKAGDIFILEPLSESEKIA